jgi:hypothetical protein
MATHFRMKNELQIQSELCEGLLISEGFFGRLFQRCLKKILEYSTLFLREYLLIS